MCLNAMESLTSEPFGGEGAGTELAGSRLLAIRVRLNASTTKNPAGEKWRPGGVVRFRFALGVMPGGGAIHSPITSLTPAKLPGVPAALE